jgi:hypothetical protein
MEDALIILDWRDVNHESGRWEHRWQYELALYAVIHPRTDEIIYIGKADGSTVRARWNAADKHDRVWRRMEQERGISEHGFVVGEFQMPEGIRLTRQLVCDIEAMLIYAIQPWANTSNTASRGLYSRPASPFRAGGTGRSGARHSATASEGKHAKRLPYTELWNLLS